MSWNIIDEYNESNYLVSRITIKRHHQVDYGQFVEPENLDSFELSPDEIGYEPGNLIYIYQCSVSSSSDMTGVSYTHDVWINNQKGKYIILILLHPLDNLGERKKVKRTDQQVSNIKPNQF